MELDPKILAALHERLPGWVRGVESRESLDANGDSVIVVFLLVKPDAKIFEDQNQLAKARDTVARVFDEHGLGWWPYVRFVNEAEWRASA